MTRAAGSPAVATETLEVGVCPACGRRPQEDERTGFCTRCAAGSLAERYLAADAEAIADRRSSWVDRTTSARELWRASDRERQRRHRLLERVRPREAAPSHADPYVMAEEALVRLARLRPAIRRGSRLAPELEAVEELVRQLAWGPVDHAVNSRALPLPPGTATG